MKCLVLRLKSEVNNDRLPYYFQTISDTLSLTTNENIIQTFDYLPQGNYMLYVLSEASLPRVEDDFPGLKYIDGSTLSILQFSKNYELICHQFNIEANVAEKTYLRLYVNTFNIDYTIMLKYYGDDVPFINLTNHETFIDNTGAKQLILYRIGLPVGDYQMTVSRDSQIESDSYLSVNSYVDHSALYGSGILFDRDVTSVSKSFKVNETIPCYVRLYISSNVNIIYRLTLTKTD